MVFCVHQARAVSTSSGMDCKGDALREPGSRDFKRPAIISQSAPELERREAASLQEFRNRSGTPQAAPKMLPTTAPRWQLSPPTMALAMIPAEKSRWYFQTR